MKAISSALKTIMGALELFLIVPAILGAILTSALFFWGAWQFVRHHGIEERLREWARSVGLLRADENPIIRSVHDSWEGAGVMNPAAVIAGGRTHLFYRAVGTDGVSRIGYALSKDGRHVDERLPYPVFALAATAGDESFARSRGLLASGGGFAGVEDPRAVIIGDRLYLSFNAFSGWHSLRIGVSSIRVEDLLARRWKWSAPVYLSPEGQVHKNWVLFPEKINGRFAVLHNLHADSPERVRVDYIDTFEQYDALNAPQSPDPQQMPDKKIAWHSRMRSAGPPPIKTPDGWLVLYHATDREWQRYKMGALLLDLADPTKVIARAQVPVLTPDAHYENDGKPGIVYACGATVVGDSLFVYYGGGDKVVCVAKTSLSRLLKKLRGREAREGIASPLPAVA